MISQFFEVQIKEGQINRYLDLAASLKPSLEAMGGCLFIDRFKSLSRKNLLLSYQIWQDEGSMIAWRGDPKRRPPTFVVASESRNRELSVETPWKRDVFESVYRPGIFAHLVDVPSSDAGVAFGRKLFADSATEYFRVFEVMRDYGMFNRGEAPQYSPPVPRPVQ